MFLLQASQIRNHICRARPICPVLVQLALVTGVLAEPTQSRQSDPCGYLRAGSLGDTSPLRRNVHYNRAMLEPFTRDRIIEALQAMPPDATLDDAIERLVFLAKIETGLAELDRSEGVPHDEAKHRFGL